LTEQDIDKFDELFSKDLSNEEYAKLQLLMDTDEMFKYKLILYRKLTQEISQEAENAEILKSRFRRIDIKSKGTRKLVWLRLAIAASLLILIGVGFRYLYHTETRNEAIYATFKKSEPGLSLRMASDNIVLLDSAMIAFKKEDYITSMSLLNRSILTDTIRYYQGVCYEMQGHDIDAEKSYSETLNSNSTFIAHKAKYRLMLVYLKLNDARYKKLLEEIIMDGNSPYQASAIKIQSMLKS